MLIVGQYGKRTGVTQTDGIMKYGESKAFPWLTADKVPTLGTWLRAAGYSTHYFGKWHLSDPANISLDKFGFDDWELSYPEPHGSLINNLGIYRDPGFVDCACTFLNRQGCGVPYTIASAQSKGLTSTPPWFSVLSLVNPHDIATYPALIGTAIEQSPFGPLSVPLVNKFAKTPEGGSISIPLNKHNFPQQNAHNEKTWNESLENKPSCQKDYSYKMGFALSAKNGMKAASSVLGPDESIVNNKPLLQLAADVALKSSVPFALAAKQEETSELFIQFYAYLHSLMDAHIKRVLQTLKDSGQDKNTIVIFLADHGEYAASHNMMMEKWHTAYEEIIHVPAVIKLPPSIPANHDNKGVRIIDSVTSHIDILPTILGLAGMTSDTIQHISDNFTTSYTIGKDVVTNFPGVDLSNLVLTLPGNDGAEQVILDRDGTKRKGVLFVTNDEITAPLPGDTEVDINSENLFAVYNQIVETVKLTNPAIDLASSSVKQPNNVHCVRSDDNYKLVKYFDPYNIAADEWEMYDLSIDTHEEVNLLNYQTGQPISIDVLQSKQPLVKLTYDEIQQKSDELKLLLSNLEAQKL